MYSISCAVVFNAIVLAAQILPLAFCLLCFAFASCLCPAACCFFLLLFASSLCLLPASSVRNFLDWCETRSLKKLKIVTLRVNIWPLVVVSTLRTCEQ